MKKNSHIVGVLFIILNGAFLLSAAKVSELIVSIHRLDEARKYMLTPEEEAEIFFNHTIILLLIESFIILMVITFFKIKKYNNSTVILNLVIHALLILLCVFAIYQSTINGL